MSPVIFLDILAYSGAGLGAAFFFWVGFVLLRPRGAVACLSILVTEDRARQCVQEGSFEPDRARSLGLLFVLFAASTTVCIVREITHL